SDAAAMGYKVVSVSGGEPLIYRGLETVLDHAKAVGLQTTVTTNGFFIGQGQLSRLRGLVDVLAISLDGPPELHNELRGSPQAFERLRGNVENLRNAGIPFGFIHTLTSRNWEHLLWTAEFAAENEAGLLQIQPLELNGRAKTQMTTETLPDDVLAKVYILAFALASKYSDTMKVQIDLFYREHLIEDPSMVYADELSQQLDQIVPTQLLGLLVLEPDGNVVPVAYGFSRDYAVCNIRETSLYEAWSQYLATRYSSFRSLCRRVWIELCEPNAPWLTNWHEKIVASSHLYRA